MTALRSDGHVPWPYDPTTNDESPMTTDLQDGWIVNLGHARYLEVLDLQRRLVGLRQQNLVPDALLLVEHEPVITLGRRGNTANILSTVEELASQGIQIHQAERGGDVTYHGPGQLVAYPIVHLTQRGISIRTYVHILEEIVIQTLDDFDIRAGREPQHRGVWVGEGKVAALGVAIKRWVSFHGFALNVSPNLDQYYHIKPCELSHEQVTSMASLLGETVGLAEVTEKLLSNFIQLFPGKWRILSPDDLLREIEIDVENQPIRGIQG